MKIAIVGSGISGLVCARQLNERHDVTLFESEDRLGGHTHTVDVEIGDERHRIDTGFIVYNEQSYPNFCALLAELGVATRPSDMSFGLRCEQTGLEWASHGLDSIFAQRRNLLRPTFISMLRDVVRFNREARELLDHPDEKASLGEYLRGKGYGAPFIEHYIVPMGAAIWSAEPSQFLAFPASTFVRFFQNHGLLERPSPVSWRVVRGGSRSYIAPLIAPFRDRIETGSPVEFIRRRRDAVELGVRGEVREFDRVVLATHSDQALRLLTDASSAERGVLGRLRYQRNEVLLHTDHGVMPRSRRAWASWNYCLPERSRGPVFVTYYMNRLQGIESRHDFFVSLNARNEVDPRRVLRRFVYHHPIFDGDAISAQKLHGSIDGVRRTHFCGAYWRYGFHEDGVASALEVCRRIEESSS